MIHSLTINTSEKYNIYIRKNILIEVPYILKNKYKVGNILYVISDIKFKDNYALILKKSCDALKIKTVFIYIESTELNKYLKTVHDICNNILQNNINRNTSIIALGGGIIGDIAGFCASILLRGIPYFQIPTTLLSQVDSSLGGKTGVNSEYGKNTIGSFYQPKAVFIDIQTLETLSYRDFISGYAECLKYSLLYDEEYFIFLNNHIKEIKNINLEIIQKIIIKSLEFKKTIIEQDEFETKNIRIMLNLGHTFGHAFEKYNSYNNNLTHGEAVGIGILFAFAFAEKNNICCLGEYERVKYHISNIGLPNDIKKIIKNLDSKQLINLMKRDKKNINENISLILPNKIGKCDVYNTSYIKITDFIDEYLKQPTI